MRNFLISFCSYSLAISCFCSFSVAQAQQHTRRAPLKRFFKKTERSMKKAIWAYRFRQAGKHLVDYGRKPKPLTVKQKQAIYKANELAKPKYQKAKVAAFLQKEGFSKKVSKRLVNAFSYANYGNRVSTYNEIVTNWSGLLGRAESIQKAPLSSRQESSIKAAHKLGWVNEHLFRGETLLTPRAYVHLNDQSYQTLVKAGFKDNQIQKMLFSDNGTTIVATPRQRRENRIKAGKAVVVTTAATVGGLSAVLGAASLAAGF
jgi:hypothetical protein